MGQKKINKSIDYLYKLQIDETNHQNHRMGWILAAQTLLFAGLCGEGLAIGSFVHKTTIVTILLLVGFCISISSVYSMIVGELSIGNIMEKWDEFNQREVKPKHISHLIIAAPKAILDSRLRFLSLYSFAPKVFCAAWLVLLTAYLSSLDISIL